MHSSRNKQKYEKSALRISITGSTIFVILEIVMAVITRSQAVLLTVSMTRRDSDGIRVTFTGSADVQAVQRKPPIWLPAD